MKKLITICLVCVSMLMTAGNAFAADLNPPDWRGNTGTTLQAWEFDTDNPGPMSPDWGNYLPGTESVVTPGKDMGWLREDLPYFSPYYGIEVGYGVWELSGNIEVDAVNFPEPNPEKRIWIQLTWRSQDGTAGIPTIFVTDSAGGQTGPVTDPIDVFLLGQNWIHSTYEIVLDWNPPHEFIYIEGNINVDELVIDTWCVPEPATIAFLSFGALTLIRRKRNNK